MSAQAMTADPALPQPQLGRRRGLAGAALIPLAVILASLMPQAAIAQSHGAAGIATGNAHSCTIENERAYCWGENDYGQLGDGSTTDSSVPVPVATTGALAGKKLTQISAGGGGGLRRGAQFDDHGRGMMIAACRSPDSKRPHKIMSRCLSDHGLVRP